jgi:hypothetical protein
MIIDTTEKCCSRVLPEHLNQEMWPTRVLFDEGTHIMDKSRDEDEGTFLSLLLDYMRVRKGIAK